MSCSILPSSRRTEAPLLRCSRAAREAQSPPATLPLISVLCIGGKKYAPADQLDAATPALAFWARRTSLPGRMHAGEAPSSSVAVEALRMLSADPAVADALKAGKASAAQRAVP